MEWSERMNAAIGYIEENLAGEIDFNEAAKKACCSVFHFQRMFFAIISMTPTEYARRRRLTLAARELTTGNPKVIDIAIKYGYDSPDAFTRAFRNVHGITPQAAREPGVTLAAFPRVSFHIKLEGENNMDYRIMDKPAFKVAGRIRRFTNVNKQNLVDIPEWWKVFSASQEWQKVKEVSGNKAGDITGGQILGICIDIGLKEKFSYAIAVELPKIKSPKPFETMDLPAATWAVFDTTIDDIQKCWDRIYREWFPSTGYEHSGGPELEVYMPGDFEDLDMPCQIWVPIVKKKKTASSKKK
jgi:AraC family transcriptional regulator